MNTLTIPRRLGGTTPGLGARLASRAGYRVRLVLLGVLLLCCAASVLVALPAPTAGTQQLTSRSAAPSPVPVRPANTRTAHSAPRPAPAADSVSITAPSTTVPSTTVQSIMLHWGDTLWGLARHYRTTITALQALNHLGSSTLINAGATFHVPVLPAASASADGVTPTRQAAHGDPTPMAHARPHPVSATSSRGSSDEMPSAAGGNQAHTVAAAVFGSQYACAANIITRESGWNIHATNPTSGAYGLAQALPGNKMATAGPPGGTTRPPN